MTVETVSFRPENPAVTLTAYIADPSPALHAPPRPAMIVFPGGGYSHLSPREADPIAFEFSAAGFQTFILRYSIREYSKFPNALVDASRAVAHVRANAEAYNVDPSRVFVIGFSAGGHLAAMLGTMFDTPHAAFPGMEPRANRPDGMILCYAPCDIDAENVEKAFMRTVGAGMTPKEMRAYSPEYLVTADTPPAYLWHTCEDATVPVEHSLRMAGALCAAGVPCEMHIFPRGPHGLSLSDERTYSGQENKIVPEVTQWIDEAVAWALRVGEEKKHEN